jgi:hypothetical protein
MPKRFQFPKNKLQILIFKDAEIFFCSMNWTADQAFSAVLYVTSISAKSQSSIEFP